MKSEIVIDDHGNKFWYQNGRLHREDGPAVEYSASKFFFGSLWYYHGKLIDCSSQEEFERLLRVKAFW